MNGNWPPLSDIEAGLVESDPLEASEQEIRTVVIDAGLHGERLDKALAALLPEFSRSHLQHMITQGWVSESPGGGVCAKASMRVRAAQTLSVVLRPTEESLAYTPQDMALDTVHVDSALRVLCKPAGLVVHPAPGHWSGTLLNGLLALDPKARELPRAGIVHRLDKDTSGLMMVARSRVAMDALVTAIAAREVKREYLALAQGRWRGPDVLTFDGAVGRDPRQRLRMAVLDPSQHSAKPARTHVTVIGRCDTHTLVHCRLETGRTHQIRVHLAHAGHPLAGDTLYGGSALPGLARQALHAWRLALRHPLSGEALAFQREPEADMLQALAALGLGYNPEQP